MWRLWLVGVGCGGSAANNVSVSIEASPLSGPIPLEVSLVATGEPAATRVTWAFDDGTTDVGDALFHTFLAEGTHSATVTWEADGGSATAQVDVEVMPESCPEMAEPEQTGAVTELGFLEISGVAASRLNPGIIWFHEDKNNLPQVYATDATGEILAEYDIAGVEIDDLEDIAIGRNPETGNDRIYLGDIGDNDAELLTPRAQIAVYLLSEPVVTPGQEVARGDLQVATAMFLEYPDAPHNAEALWVDPVTDDVFVVTKEVSADAEVFRKAAPHRDGEVVTLERVGSVDLTNPTAGDISPFGNQILLRTYGSSGLLWLRDGAESVADAVGRAPCEVTLASEAQSESAAFSADGRGIWTISEAVPDVWFTPFER